MDINQEYLAICKKRFEKSLLKLELICADLNETEFPDSSFDLIHAALVFEYVEVELLLSKISRWLKPQGILSVVLQLPSESMPVSETTYQSLKLLNPFMNLIKPDEFREKAKKHKFSKTRDYIIKLKSGKNFSEIIFKQNKKIGLNSPAVGMYIEPLRIMIVLLSFLH